MTDNDFGGRNREIESLVKLRKLSEFLRRNPSSLDDIMQFVALNTLEEFNVITIFLATVKHNGFVSIVAKFGCSDEGFASIPDRQVSVDVPVNRALRTGTIVDCGDFGDYIFAGPGYHKLLFPNGFAASIAFPVPTVGSVVFYCANKVTLDVELEEFLLVVGGLLSLEISGARHFDSGNLPDRRGESANFGLTSIQWQIFECARQNLSNQEISTKLALSESLIRLEMSKIFQKLGVTNRLELMKFEVPKLPVVVEGS